MAVLNQNFTAFTVNENHHYFLSFTTKTCLQSTKQFALPFTEGVLLTAGDSSGRRPELPPILDLCQYIKSSGQYNTEPTQLKLCNSNWQLEPSKGLSTHTVL